MSWLSNALFGKKQSVNTDFSGLATQAEQYTNPFSNLNSSVLNGLTNQATDIVAQQGLSNQRMGAMGYNPFADEQSRQLASSVTKNAGGGWQEGLRTSQGIGTNLLTNKAQMEFQKDSANAQMAQQRQQQISGFMGGLLGQFAGVAGTGR
jgi:hypothetical protein